MNKAQRRRWSFLLSALAATVVAMFWPEQDVDVMAPPRLAPPLTPLSPRVSATSEHQPDWIYNDENPFAQRGWVAPALQPVVAEVRAVASVDISAAPPPPPLPFKFLGQMADGAERVIYLGLGEQVLLAHAGDLLAGSYKVVAVTPTQIEFELAGSGERQTLPLPAQEP